MAKGFRTPRSEFPIDHEEQYPMILGDTLPLLEMALPQNALFRIFP